MDIEVNNNKTNIYVYLNIIIIRNTKLYLKIIIVKI